MVLPTLVIRPGFNDGLFGKAGFSYLIKKPPLPTVGADIIRPQKASPERGGGKTEGFDGRVEQAPSDEGAVTEGD